MRIGILGPLEVRDQAGQLVRLGGPRLRALLVRLALDPRRTIAAERLAADLWPDTGAACCHASMSSITSAYQRVIVRPVTQPMCGVSTGRRA